MARAEQLMQRIEAVLPQPLQAPADWARRLPGATANAPTAAACWSRCATSVRCSCPTCKTLTHKRKKSPRNTEQFVQGRTANNVLLTGARGTGKSSLIRACLHAYADQGLRLIEVDKADLTDLPDIVEVVAARPEYFIIYCDDLSFEEGEPGYKAMKSILDGSVSAATPNVLVYATSNRRHLLPEYLSDNLQTSKGQDGEIHPARWWKKNLSLRTLWPVGQLLPLQPGRVPARGGAMALQPGVGCGGRLPLAKAEALVWALERGSRSGRVAQQFARDYAGRSPEGPPTATARPRIADIAGLSDGAETLKRWLQPFPHGSKWPWAFCHSRKRRCFAADQPPERQSAGGLVGVPRWQARSGRIRRASPAPRTPRGDWHHHWQLPALADHRARLPPRPGAPALVQGHAVAGRTGHARGPSDGLAAIAAGRAPGAGGGAARTAVAQCRARAAV